MPTTNRHSAQPATGCITIQGPHGYIRLSPNCARKIARALQRAASSLDSGAPRVTIDVGQAPQASGNTEETRAKVSEGGAA